MRRCRCGRQWRWLNSCRIFPTVCAARVHSEVTNPPSVASVVRRCGRPPIWIRRPAMAPVHRTACGGAGTRPSLRSRRRRRRTTRIDRERSGSAQRVQRRLASRRSRRRRCLRRAAAAAHRARGGRAVVRRSDRRVSAHRRGNQQFGRAAPQIGQPVDAVDRRGFERRPAGCFRGAVVKLCDVGDSAAPCTSASRSNGTTGCAAWR